MINTPVLFRLSSGGRAQALGDDRFARPRSMTVNPARVVIVDDRSDLVVKLSNHGGRRMIVTHQPPHSPVTDLLERPPHAIVIGAGVPFSRSLDLCRMLRGTPALSDSIIVIISGRDGANQEFDAFAAGADDYVGPPSSPSSLAMRLAALLRRNNRVDLDADATADTPERQSISIGTMTIYELDFAVFLDGKRVVLTAGEFRVLWKLALQRDRIVPAEQLAPVDLINETYSSLTSVRSLIFSLRGKLGDHARQIQTVRRAGYRLTE